MLLNTSRREGCRLAARSALRIILTCHVVHPLPLRGIPLKGTQDVTGLASCPHSHSERSEESWYAVHMRQSAVNAGQREAAAFGGLISDLSSGIRPAPFRSGNQKESPFMGRLRANFARLGNPMQDCHLWKEPTLRDWLPAPPVILGEAKNLGTRRICGNRH